MEIFAGIFLGLIIGSSIFWFLHRSKTGGFTALSLQMISQTEKEIGLMKHKSELKIKEQELIHQKELDQEWAKHKQKIHKEELRLQTKEDKLEARMSLVEQKLSQVEKREAAISLRAEQNRLEKENLDRRSEEIAKELESISGLTRNEAREALIRNLIDEAKQEASGEIHRIRKESEEQAKVEAARIITTAINRMAVSCTSESTTYTISLPNQELKGRIVGREGRNIRLIEKLTGVNILIDDTPNAVVISGFDPNRLHIAKEALTHLIQDGRIHPTSIEVAVASAEANLDTVIKRAGEEAALKTGQIGLHPEIIKLLGGLQFRRSLGQNVLEHSIEVSHLMGLIAGELGLNVQMAKRIGLLHDMGKAAPQHYEGTHAIVGQQLALKYGESEEVANGIGCHHNEVDPITIEGSFCGAADAISGSRPGARIEAVQQYMLRLKNLEEIAYGFPGIDKAYAMQAGREIVITVLPEMIDDIGTQNLARDISQKIQSQLHYPGKIKVTVLREKRVVEYAT